MINFSGLKRCIMAVVYVISGLIMAGVSVLLLYIAGTI